MSHCTRRIQHNQRHPHAPCVSITYDGMLYSHCELRLRFHAGKRREKGVDGGESEKREWRTERVRKECGCGKDEEQKVKRNG
jgi:hypothetical protein